jgi:cysteine-S-conjugate beta-lyase
MKKDTLLVRGGRAATGPVNPPVSRASTVLFKDLGAFEATRADRFGALRYGIHGTDTLFALENALTRLEGATAPPVSRPPHRRPQKAPKRDRSMAKAAK